MGIRIPAYPFWMAMGLGIFSASATPLETETATTLCLYPNPTTAEVFIKGIERTALVEVYSTMGQLMLAQTLEPSVLTL